MKNLYVKPNPELWTGRKSEAKLYWHEKIQFLNLEENHTSELEGQNIAILGYACDEGVRRNQGRVGAKNAPDALRKSLAKQANHLPENFHLFDVGNVICENQNLEHTHQVIENQIFKLLKSNLFPIVLGGGHDLAYPHYRAIKSYLSENQCIGIINLDAHFDLRIKTDQANSGTPFYQIATEAAENKFHYLCLGIQKQANTTELFQTAEKFGVNYLMNDEYTITNWKSVVYEIVSFINSVDYVYLTIDLDGFSSAMGVSAVSPFGFSWEVVYETIKLINQSKKLISTDIVEYNPLYDMSDFTAKLGAGLIHVFVSDLA